MRLFGNTLGLFLAMASASALAQTAPILPYLLLVLILIFRPRGLLGSRED